MKLLIYSGNTIFTKEASLHCRHSIKVFRMLKIKEEDPYAITHINYHPFGKK